MVRVQSRLPFLPRSDVTIFHLTLSSQATFSTGPFLSSKPVLSAKQDPLGDVTQGSVRVIKKYPNRRLYDTQTSSYITIQEIKNLVINNQQLKVVDAKSSEDLTRSIYLQIILEEEAGGLPMFSEMVLANLIRFYGHSMQGLMGNYLENNVQNLLDLQHQIAAQSQSLTPEIWKQALSQSNPFVQNLMFNYSQQTKQMFLQIQEQMLNAIGVKR